VAADASAARSILVFKQDQDKVVQLDASKLIVGSGSFADSVNFTEYIQKNLKLYELDQDLALSTHAAANFIRKEVRFQKSFLLNRKHPIILLFMCSLFPQMASALRRGPYQTNLLLGGFDASTGQASLYFIDYLAAMAKVGFGAHGYAANFILSVFDREWHEGLTLEQGLGVVRKCIHELHTRFLISQPNFVVKVVDKDGCRVLQL
jgi:20S proteasome alpha/beta subunit